MSGVKKAILQPDGTYLVREVPDLLVNEDGSISTDPSVINSIRVKSYIFGVAWAPKKDKMFAFVVKEITSIPKDFITANEIVCSSEDAWAKANIELDCLNDPYTAKFHPTVINELSPGDIVYCADRQGVHTAIFLKTYMDQAFILFCTSNYHWNKYSRPLSKDEIKLLGYPERHKSTYFAPVIRPTESLQKAGYAFPAHRINDLINEFNHSDINVY